MDDQPTQVLLVEGDADEAAIIGTYLAEAPGSREKYALTLAPRLSTACRLLEQQAFDVVLLDLVLPLSVGLEGFRKIHGLRPAAPIIVLTGLRDAPLAVQAVNLGADDYLTKGSPDCCLLKRAIRYAIEKKRLTQAIAGLVGARDAASSGSPRPRTQTLEGLRVAAAKDHLINRVSHELRNTLSTLKTAAFCLKEGVGGTLTPQQAQLVEMISRNTDRQTKIIVDVLDLVRFQTDGREMRLGPVDLSAVIAQVVEEYGTGGAAPRLLVAIEGGLPAVAGDPDLIAQVLRNLIDNALRFAERKVLVEASTEESGSVSVSVADDGADIPADRLGELFTEFARLERTAGDDGARTDAYKGTGLGLTICREIVESHHGKIWAEKAPGQGARFRLILPLHDQLRSTAAEKELVVAGGPRSHSGDK